MALYFKDIRHRPYRKLNKGWRQIEKALTKRIILDIYIESFPTPRFECGTQPRTLI